jgi:hypothetical protein
MKKTTKATSGKKLAPAKKLNTIKPLTVVGGYNVK